MMLIQVLFEPQVADIIPEKRSTPRLWYDFNNH